MEPPVAVEIIITSWNIFRRKFVGRVRDKQASFADSAIADNDALDGLHCWRLVDHKIGRFNGCR